MTKTKVHPQLENAVELNPASGTVRLPSERPVDAEETTTALSLPTAAGATLQDRFRLGPLLGRGGMGEVQQAVDLGLRRSVAVKTWRAVDAPDDVKQRFVVEARVTAQLEHPNILPIYSLEQAEGGTMAFVMRLIRGRTMHEYLGKVRDSHTAGYVKPQHRLEARIDMFLKVCDAIDYAHSRGVIHRDLKPENVMLGAHGQVYVMDWGLALLTGEAAAESVRAPAPVPLSVTGHGARLTSAGDVLGTPEYMAPEQARGAVALGPAVDQYALGLMLFELTSLAHARDNGGGPMEIVAAREGRLEPLKHRYGHRIPHALRKIIERATQLRPEDRYASVRAFSDDLHRYVHGEAPEVAPDPFFAALWRKLNRRPLVAMSLFLALLLSAMGGVSVSLYNALTERKRAAQEAKLTTRLTSSVLRESEVFEGQLDDVRLALEGFARATEQLWRHGAPHPDPKWVSAPALSGEDGTKLDRRYGQRINLEHVAYVLAPDTSPDAVQAPLAKLAHVREHMKSIYGREDGVPLLWIYAGFENGLMINYPGNDDYPEGYDPRKRPWYRIAKNETGHQWGRPYRDISGGTLQLPSSRALFDESNAFIGLVAIDVSLNDLAAKLHMPDIPGWKESYLVDDDGKVIVDTKEVRDVDVPKSDALELQALDIPEVVDAIRDERAVGTVEDDERRVVYVRLDVIPWYVVVVVDEQSFSEGQR